MMMTRLSCRRFHSNEVWLWLSAIAYNLWNLLRRLVTMGAIHRRDGQGWNAGDAAEEWTEDDFRERRCASVAGARWRGGALREGLSCNFPGKIGNFDADFNDLKFSFDPVIPIDVALRFVVGDCHDPCHG